MKENNIIRDKSFVFALNSINVYKDLVNIHKETVLSKQFLKSATSIGANIEEAIGAQSKADFISKLAISYKEARETKYWILLLSKSNYLNIEIANKLLEDVEELLKIIGKIQITLKNS